MLVESPYKVLHYWLREPALLQLLFKYRLQMALAVFVKHLVYPLRRQCPLQRQTRHHAGWCVTLKSFNNGLPDFLLPILFGIRSLTRTPQKDLERGGSKNQPTSRRRIARPGLAEAAYDLRLRPFGYARMALQM